MIKFKKCIFILFLLPFCLKAQDSTKYGKELSAKTALVIPVFYGLHPDFHKWITPSFKLSYLLNIQYKTKRNWLWEVEFQPYSFSYSGPDKIITGTYPTGSNGTNPVTSSDTVFQKLKFSYLKFQLGMGKQFNFRRGFAAFTFGVAFFTGSLGDARINVSVQTCNSRNGSLMAYGYNSQKSFDTLSVLNEMPRVSPFFGISGGYFLTKKLTLIGGLNYTPFLMAKIGDASSTSGDTIYILLLQELVSVSVGVKFNILGINPDRL